MITDTRICPAAPTLPQSLSAHNFAFLQAYVYSASGIVLDGSKQYLLEARLVSLVEQCNLRSLNALSERLAARPSDPVGRLVVEAMTTNETLFFRDRTLFDTLRTQVFPELFKRVASQRRIRIWSAAASTGQEAYSLAIMLLEAGHSHAEVDIVGTDLSNQVLARARQGSYTHFEVNRGLTPALLSKYFLQQGLDWQIKDSVKRFVRFENLNLRSSFSELGCFDLILCRNVLIYFDAETKREIIERIQPLLLPGGLLTLGATETIMQSGKDLQRKQLGPCTFYAMK